MAKDGCVFVWVTVFVFQVLRSVYQRSKYMYCLVSRLRMKTINKQINWIEQNMYSKMMLYLIIC